MITTIHRAHFYEMDFFIFFNSGNTVDVDFQKGEK